MALNSLSHANLMYLQHRIDSAFEEKSQVFILDLVEDQAQQLGKILGIFEPSENVEMLSVVQLVHKINQAKRTQIPLFQKPTLIITCEQDGPYRAPEEWSVIEQAAKSSPCLVEFKNAGEPVVVSLFNKKGPK
jgi:hypothetical protein